MTLTRRSQRAYAANGTRGFTIVEMLLVVGIIMLLLAIMLPSLSAVQKRSRKMVELNHLRQIGMAWNMYANQYNDAALPGFLDYENGPQPVREAWRVRYEYPMPPQFGGGADGMSLTIPDEVSAPWTWRLGQYFDYNPDILRGYSVDVQEGVQSLVDDAETVAYQPAFGYNAYYVGGWWRVASVDVGDGFGDTASTRPRFSMWDAEKDGSRINVVVRNLSNIARPENMVIFCSTTEYETGQHNFVQDDIPGSHLATPPNLAMQEKWQIPAVGGGGGGGGGVFSAGGGSDRNTIEVMDSTAHAPVGRHNRLAAVLYADGSTVPEAVAELHDQRRWINGLTGDANRFSRHQGTVWD